jgi:hypothetical protein
MTYFVSIINGKLERREDENSSMVFGSDEMNL